LRSPAGVLTGADGTSSACLQAAKFAAINVALAAVFITGGRARRLGSFGVGAATVISIRLATLRKQAGFAAPFSAGTSPLAPRFDPLRDLDEADQADRALLIFKAGAVRWLRSEAGIGIKLLPG